MSFAKMAIIFLILAAFSITVVGMFSMMLHDKPTDAYYDDPNSTIKGTTDLITSTMGSGSTLMLPLIGVAGILVLGAGFMTLRRK